MKSASDISPAAVSLIVLTVVIALCSSLA